MKAAVYHGRGDVRVEERPEPQVRPGTIKVKVDWCGICGTDLHEYEEGPIFVPPPGKPHPITGETLPIILGHEFAGTVAELGPGVTGFRIGERVAVDPIYACAECDECRRGDFHLCRKLGFHGLSGGGGGFSEYTVVPAERTYGLGEIDTAIGAMVEPLAVAFHAVRNSGLRPGDTAIVYGAGPIGQATIACLKAAGAGTILVVEVAAARQRMARTLKADVILDPREVDVAAEVLKLTRGRGADVAFDCAGLQATVNSAMDTVRRGGSYVMIAIWAHPAQVDMLSLVLREINLVGSICYNRDFPRVISLLRDGRIDPTPMITGRIELDDIVQGGFEELLANRDRHVKILVRPS
jgi:(R,R)-butanediol dehydrogenase/meso-butanediol dehydrogenase/diacetyl reductase